MPTDREIREAEDRYRKRYSREPFQAFEGERKGLGREAPGAMRKIGGALWRGAGWVSQQTPLGFGIDQAAATWQRGKMREFGKPAPAFAPADIARRKAEADAYRDYVMKAKRKGMTSVVSFAQFTKNPMDALESVESYQKPGIGQLYAKEQVAKEAAEPGERPAPRPFVEPLDYPAGARRLEKGYGIYPGSLRDIGRGGGMAFGRGPRGEAYVSKPPREEREWWQTFDRRPRKPIELYVKGKEAGPISPDIAKRRDELLWQRQLANERHKKQLAARDKQIALAMMSPVQKLRYESARKEERAHQRAVELARTGRPVKGPTLAETKRGQQLSGVNIQIYNTLLRDYREKNNDNYAAAIGELTTEWDRIKEEGGDPDLVKRWLDKYYGVSVDPLEQLIMKTLQKGQ